MKPFKEVIHYPADNSFVIKYDDFEHFSVPWHFHNEYELVYVLKSHGKKFVGDIVEDFGPGDITLYGSQLPHFYLNDEAFYQGDPGLRVNAIVIQFPTGYFPPQQLVRPEFASVKRILAAASAGVRFSRDTVEKVDELFKQLLMTRGMERHLLFVKLVDQLGNGEFRQLTTSGYQNAIDDHGELRMARIYRYLSRNYNRKITLQEVADQAGMNPAAFCRYFKQKTNKTFAQFVNELRISYACKMLRHGNQTIVHVCDEAGFTNLSNFNRQFRQITGKSPSEYRTLLQSPQSNKQFPK